MLIFNNPAPAQHHYDRAQSAVNTRITTYVAEEAATRARLALAPQDPAARAAWIDASERAAHWQRPEAVEKFAVTLAFFELINC